MRKNLPCLGSRFTQTVKGTPPAGGEMHMGPAALIDSLDLTLFDGEAAEVIRAKDWSHTPVGPIEQWSPALKLMVSTLLACRHPMFLFWGPELTQFYNDAYIPSFGLGQHPRAMGQPGRECW